MSWSWRSAINSFFWFCRLKSELASTSDFNIPFVRYIASIAFCYLLVICIYFTLSWVWNYYFFWAQEAYCLASTPEEFPALILLSNILLAFAFIFVGLHRIDYDLTICGCSFLIRFVFVNLWQKFGNIFELFIVDLTLIMRLSDKYLFCMTDMRLKKVRELFHLKLSLKVQKCEALALLLVNRINGQSSWI